MWQGRRQGGWWWVVVLFQLIVVTSPARLTTASPPPPLTPTSSPSSAPSTPATKPPHIIFIVADDLGWNDVSWHNKQVVTPQLEALARSGVLLEQSYVQPICTPTRSALLAGRYPFTIGRQHGVLRPSEPTGLNLDLTLLPQSLKAAGYSTHAVGKWHLGFCSWAYTPTRRGFDTFYGYYNGAEDYYTHERSNLFDPRMDTCNDPSTEDCTWDPNTPDAGGRSWLDLRNNTVPDHSKEGVYSSYVFASYVEQLVSTRRNSEEPMFLYLAFQSVHAPLQVPANYTKPYRHIHHRDRRTYLGMVSAMDEAVGRVVAALKASGHYNNTIIVFTTDNGGPTVHSANNWPLRGHKTTLWEGGTRGAAFIHSPLLPNPGTVHNQLVHVTDWYRTLVGVAGGVVPSDTDGVDQWAAITGAAPSPRTHMVYNIDNTTNFKAGVRLGDYKLLVGDPGKGDWTPPPEVTHTSPHHLTTANHSPERPTVTSADTPPPPDLPQADLRLSNDILGHLRSTKAGHLDDIVELGHTTAVREMALPSTTGETQPLQLPTERTAATQYIQNLIFTRRKHRGAFIFSADVPDSKSRDVDNDVRRPQDLVNTGGASSLTSGHQTTTPPRHASSPSIINITNTSDVNTPSTASITDVSTASITDVSAVNTTDVGAVNTTDVSAVNTTDVSAVNTTDVGAVNTTDVGAVNTTDVSAASNSSDTSEMPGPGQGQEEVKAGGWEAGPGVGLNEVARHLLQLLTKKNDSQIRLYNIKEDPEERVNLATTRLEVVVEALQFLLQQVNNYVPADVEPEVPSEANPDRWHGVWSPGWC